MMDARSRLTLVGDGVTGGVRVDVAVIDACPYAVAQTAAAARRMRKACVIFNEALSLVDHEKLGAPAVRQRTGVRNEWQPKAGRWTDTADRQERRRAALVWKVSSSCVCLFCTLTWLIHLKITDIHTHTHTHSTPMGVAHSNMLHTAWNHWRPPMIRAHSTVTAG